MTTTEAANNHYQELENFRKELANSGRTPTEEELQLRSNKILALMRECQALQNDPTVVDKSARWPDGLLSCLGEVGAS